MSIAFIPTKVHGIIDYTVGSLLTSSPLFDKGSKETAILMGQGVVATAYSLFTNYEAGASRKIPMRTHLALDVLSGILIAGAPYLFNLKKKSQIPFLAIGLFEIATALLTKDEPEE